MTLPACESCTLDLRDTYGDTWSNNYFNGFGLRETVTSEDNSGRSKSIEFTSPGCSADVSTDDDSDSGDDDTEDDNDQEEDETEGFVRGDVTVGGGTYKSEVRWNITCGDPQIIRVSEEQGRAPYSDVVVLPACTSCTLNMRDTYSDTWSGNYFVGFGLNETITSSDNGGRFKSVTFTSEGCPEEETDDDDVELDDDDEDDDDERDEDTQMEFQSSFYMAAYYDSATDYYFPGAELEGGFNTKKGALNLSASLALMALAMVSMQ